MTFQPVGSRLPRWPASRRRGTTPNAALHATRSRRQRITFSPRTLRGEGPAFAGPIAASQPAHIPNLESSKERAMKRVLPLLVAIIALAIAVLGHRASSAQDEQDKYTL